MNLDNIDRVILTCLPHYSEGLRPSTFFFKYKIMPEILAFSVNKLLKIGLVEKKEDKIYLSKRGYELIQSKKIAIDSEKKWKQVPLSFKQSSIPTFKPYAPLRNLLDKSLL